MSITLEPREVAQAIANYLTASTGQPGPYSISFEVREDQLFAVCSNETNKQSQKPPKP